LLYFGSESSTTIRGLLKINNSHLSNCEYSFNMFMTLVTCGWVRTYFILFHYQLSIIKVYFSKRATKRINETKHTLFVYWNKEIWWNGLDSCRSTLPRFCHHCHVPFMGRHGSFAFHILFVQNC